MFKITIVKLGTDADAEIGAVKSSVELFAATVEELELAPIIAMIYRPKRKPRADAGKSRKAV